MTFKEGGLAAILDCDFSAPLKIVEKESNFLGFKFPSKISTKIVLAHKFTDKKCDRDPSYNDCKVNLYYSNNGIITDWWILNKNVVKYDFIEDRDELGVLVLS